MLFHRRSPETIAAQMRIALWPRRSWRRSLRYQRLRLARLQANPHTVAMGLAVGVFVAALPIIGLQVVTAVALAWALRGSIGAAIIGTFAANPLTYPGLWLLSYETGCLILGAGSLFGGSPEAAAPFDRLTLEIFADQSWRLLKPMLVGAVPLGLVVGVLCYFLGRRLMVSWRESRQAG
jgi:uncharacterized protein (DUF2062 family)